MPRPQNSQTLFTDISGREWDCRFTFAAARRVAKKTGCKLSDVVRPGSESLKLIADQATFFDVLWILLEPQAATAGVTEDAFAESMDGETFDRAFDAIVECAILHAPAHQREKLRAAVAAVRKAQELGIQLSCDLVSKSIADMETRFAELKSQMGG